MISVTAEHTKNPRTAHSKSLLSDSPLRGYHSSHPRHANFPYMHLCSLSVARHPSRGAFALRTPRASLWSRRHYNRYFAPTRQIPDRTFFDIATLKSVLLVFIIRSHPTPSRRFPIGRINQVSFVEIGGNRRNELLFFLELLLLQN